MYFDEILNLPNDPSNGIYLFLLVFTALRTFQNYVLVYFCWDQQEMQGIQGRQKFFRYLHHINKSLFYKEWQKSKFFSLVVKIAAADRRKNENHRQ